MIETIPLELDAGQEQALLADVREQLALALETHEAREKRFAEYLRAYNAKPEFERKDFPWKGASNVVVPIAGITVDALTARLRAAVLKPKDFAEVTIKAAEWEGMEDPLRDWINDFVDRSGAKDRVGTIGFDMAVFGAAYVKNLWVEEMRRVHAYDPAGGVVRQDIPTYVGPKWHVMAPQDAIYPGGYDEWRQLPVFFQRLRYTWVELRKLEKEGAIEDIASLKAHRKEPQDAVRRERDEGQISLGAPYELFEVQGTFEIPPREDAPEGSEPELEELILLYSQDTRKFHRKIYNPYFGHRRHVVQVPYLHQAHSVEPKGAVQMVLSLQAEATTSHNQKIDAATAANAGIVAVTPDANVGTQEEIYPGKKIVTEKPGEDIAIYHLSEPSRALADVESEAFNLAEKVTGVSVYNLGMESGIVGSRATATGTTALISEGNVRHWVSIDDMRSALTELLYLTIELEQQHRPEGTPYGAGKTITFPQGDVRSAIGLKITLTSEQVNRDLEVQNLQILMQVLDQYYQLLSTAVMSVVNPQIPEPAKIAIVQVMTARYEVTKRYIERFDVEVLDAIVPSIQQVLMGMQGGQQSVPGAPTPGPGGAPSLPPGGIPAGGQPIPPGGREGSMAPPGSGPVPIH